MILLQEGETLSRGNDDFAIGGIQLAGQNLQEGRFSRAVGSDETVAVTLGKFDIDIFE